MSRPRGKFPGWSLQEDGYLDEPEPPLKPKPRRLGCSIFVAILAVVLLSSWVPGVSAEEPAGGVDSRGKPQPAAVSVGGHIHGGRAFRTRITAAPAVSVTIYSASATWCAPTPDKCQDWGGNARLAAVNSFRFGDEPYPVRVWRGDTYVDVTVVSFCACHGELGYIDLSPAAFEMLAPLSRGRIAVEVEVLVDLTPDPRDDAMRDEVRDLPATDTAQ